MKTTRSRRRRALCALATVGVLALAGCGTDEPTDPGTAAPTTGMGGAAGAPVPGGGLTVAEALEENVDGPVTVTGLLIDEGDGVRLCDTVLESYPPQCGDPSMSVEGIDVAQVDGAQSEGGTTWVDQASLTGTVDDATLHVADTVS